MNFFWRKEADFAKAMGGYLDRVRACADTMAKAFEVLLREGVSEEFEELEREVSELESEADRERRDLEHRLYGGVFLAESRGDYLGLLEALDKMPDSMESVVRDIAIMKVTIPEAFAGEMRDLVAKSVEAVEETCTAASMLFSSVDEALQRARHVDHLESDADDIEVSLLRRIFAADGDLAHKLILKEVVGVTARIADRAENASDRIEIIAIKRKA